MHKILFFSTLSLLIISLIFALGMTNITSNYDFEFVSHQWLTMPDGIKLSVNYWKPKAKFAGEKFPIVLEVLPYRKDDMHFAADYAIGAYFAKHGIGFARVDIRGTGASQGVVPDREYSDQELADIREVIKQLTVLPWSNGNIGMQGISWSAFNAIMTAMQRVPGLKGILVAHGSEDLYANDIHNIDGALHIDIFTVEIETDNLLPQAPKYEINQAYFVERFDQKPWIFTYLHHQRDSAFWETGRSLRTNYAAIDIPVFALASLLDGYRDFAINMAKHLQSPIRVSVGPQNHSWPDGTPGPQYEWRHMAVRFWQQVLNGKETGFWNQPLLTVFQRGGVPPNIHLKHTPGSYRVLDWPIANQKTLQLFLQNDKSLATKPDKQALHALAYKPSVGHGVLNWWGETTPDMRVADAGTLVYDSAVLDKDYEVLGNPYVNLSVAADAPLAHWIVRLEDVNPTGSVSLVTGGLKNGAQRESRENPQAIQPGKFFTLQIPLHFTTWKFAKGHRIRLIVANAQFPMIWPTPYKMTTQLMIGEASHLFLPLIEISDYPEPKLPALEGHDVHPEIKFLKQIPLLPYQITQQANGATTASAFEENKFSVYGNIVHAKYKVLYRVNDSNPADTLFIGEGEDSVEVSKEKRTVRVHAIIRIQSDEKYFHTTVERKIFENNKLLRTRQWQESIPRDFE